MKNTVADLALFGGCPAFAENLCVGRPNIGDEKRLLSRIKDLLRRRWLTNNGPYVQEFERRIEAMTGAKHVVAICNATIALEIVIRALGLTGEVILPSFTFIATAHALQWQEITPVFCDVQPCTHHLDPAQIEQAITPRTTGIIGVHLWGEVCDVEALTAIAARHNLPLLFDAAHAFGCSHQGRRVGNFGTAEVFSFHATKCLNSFEGGAIVTNDDALATRLRLMRNFGFEDYDSVIHLGTNGKMTEVCAAMGLTNLESWETFQSLYCQNYRQYRQELDSIPGVNLYRFREDEPRNYAYIVLEIDDDASLSRDELMQILHAERVLARRYFFPGCHAMEPYRSRCPKSSLRLPETERLARRVLTLPTGSSLGPKEITRICGMIRWALEHGPEIRGIWPNSSQT
jgi:dTDP-4-amino-4,6-dideoxygalactose transaminase